MTYEELKQAAKVFHHIDEIRRYVSKERFAVVASTMFGIDDERKADVMYGLMNLTPRLVYYVANDTEEFRKENRWPGYMKLLPKAMEIAEAAYELLHHDWGFDDIPYVEYGDYRREDRRRYFYAEDGREKTLDVSLHSKSDIVMLSGLLQRDGVKMRGVAEHLGYLEGEMQGNTREKFQYFFGDIYFLYADVADRIFYDYWSRGGEAGVYVATKDGWRRLLYTPGRGYVNREGNLEYEDDKHFYSDYKLEQSGMKFRYVGNAVCDAGVLREPERKKGDILTGKDD